MREECAKGKIGLLLKVFLGDRLKELLSDHIIEMSMEMIKVEGGIAILLSEHSSDCDVLELIIEKGPLVTKSDHVFKTFLMLLLEQYGGGGLDQGVQHQCIVQTGCCFLLLLWG